MVAATQHHGMGWGGVGWGMITFLALAHMVAATQHQLSCTCTHGWCYATSWDGVGWGGVGDDNVPCTCTHGRCYATSTFLYLHTWSLLRNIMGWGGVGWGGVGDDNVPCTCTHGRCYATSTFLYLHTWSVLRNIIFLVLAHMVAATQHHGMGWGGVGWGMITFLALAHMVAATQHHLSCTFTHGRCYATSWDGVGWGGVGDDNVPCTCTHGRRYATSSFLYLHTWSLLRNIMGWGWGGVGWGMITFLALAHMVAATQHQLSCTCTHGRCYATSWDGVGWGGVGDEVCKERRDSFVLTAGDNCAESLCAVSKN